LFKTLSSKNLFTALVVESRNLISSFQPNIVDFQVNANFFDFLIEDVDLVLAREHTVLGTTK